MTSARNSFLRFFNSYCENAHVSLIYIRIFARLRAPDAAVKGNCHDLTFHILRNTTPSWLVDSRYLRVMTAVWHIEWDRSVSDPLRGKKTAASFEHDPAFPMGNQNTEAKAHPSHVELPFRHVRPAASEWTG
jgi:hypothetical protein